MPQQTKLITKRIPAPLAGLNLIASPLDVAEDEADVLDNYYIYDWGIRERAALTDIGPLPDGGGALQMFAFSSAGLNKQYILLDSSSVNVYLYDGTSFSAWHAGTNFSGACAFNKKIILPLSGAASVDTLNVADGARTAAAFVTTGNCIGSFVYNNRVYLLNNNSSLLEYGGVGAVAGAVAGFDFGQVFQKGQKIIFGTSWSYNQGQINSDLMVIGNEAGEILIYSGDYPAAANFQLVTKLQIPAPLTVPGLTNLANVLKLGQDILINSSRGVLSLSQIMAGKNDETGYYALSRKLGNVLTGAQSDLSLNVPFAYFAGGTGSQDVYVLNYERGAWSKFPTISGADQIKCIACQSQPITSSVSGYASYTLIAAGTKIFKIIETDSILATDSTTNFVWQTPYFDFETPNIKTTNRVRVVGRDVYFNIATSVYNKVYVYSDFKTPGTSDSLTTSGNNFNTYIPQELRPTGEGRWLSYRFDKTNAEATRMNEIAGMDIYVESSRDS